MNPTQDLVLIQDIVDVFWVINAESKIDKRGNDLVKRLIPEKYWPKE